MPQGSNTETFGKLFMLIIHLTNMKYFLGPLEVIKFCPRSEALTHI